MNKRIGEDCSVLSQTAEGDKGTTNSRSGNKIIFTAEVQVSKPFIAWCCSFGTGVKVTAPKSVADMVKNYLAETLGQY